MKDFQITEKITNRETAAVELYFDDISREALLSAREEVLLAQKIRQGDRAALDRLVRANLRFVVSVAKRYQYQGLPLSDLINEGNLGLIHAAKLFDETRGFKFISLAVWWIRQSIVAAIAENARMIRLPLNRIQEITRINRARVAVEQQCQHEPTAEQLAEYLEIVPEKVSDALSHAAWTVSGDAPLAADDDYQLWETIASEDAGPDHELVRESILLEAEALLEQLTQREKTVIRLAFGIGRERELSNLEIAGVIGSTKEGARQIRKEAMEKLRSAAERGAGIGSW